MATEVTTNSLDGFTREIAPRGSDFFVQFERSRPALELVNISGKVPFNGNFTSDGRGLFFHNVIRGGPNAAVPLPEGGAYAQPSSPDRDRVRFNLRSINKRVRLTGLVKDTATGMPYTIADEVMFQLEQAREDAQKEMNWTMHQDGSGLRATLATAAAVSGGNTITVDTTDRLKVGDALNINARATGTTLPQDVGAPSVTIGVKVTSITNDTTFVVSASNGANPQFTTLADGSAYGVYYKGSQGQALWGFANFTSDLNPSNHGSTVLFGDVDRSVPGNEYWNAGHRINANGAQISIRTHIQVLQNRILKKAGTFLNGNRQLTPDNQAFMWIGFTGFEVNTALGNALKADQTTAPNNITLKGGFRSVEYNGLVPIVDNDAPPDRLRLIHPGSLERFVNRDWSVLEETGSMWRPGSDVNGEDADVYILTLLTRQALVGVRMNVHGEVYNLSATF